MQLTVSEARQLYDDADSVHDFDHILRVLALAERIARVEGADIEIVRTAALLHDWGRALAQEAASDHAQVAAQRAHDYLTARGSDPSWTAAVEHAIAAHRFRTRPNPQTIEAQVLFDADKLDAIGAIGVARAFAYGGAHNQRLWASRDEVDRARWAEQGDDPEAHTPVHEFVVKLTRIKERLYTGEGRRIAEGRHRYMLAFYDRLDAEVRGEA
ncbi:MAG: HD domain-containing protein [Anaerolineae bacterium]